MKKLIIFAAVFLSGCASVTENVVLTSNNSTPSKVLIYREGSFHAGGSSLLIGRDEKYFIKLKNDQYAEFEIDSGRQVLEAKASGSPASQLALDLVPGQKTCIKAEPNPKSLGAILIPIIGNMVPTFNISKVPCPTEKDLSKYEYVRKS